MEKPADNESAPNIPSTLKLHRVIRDFNMHKVCKLQFFKITTDETSFFEQFYHIEGDPGQCDHPHVPLSFDFIKPVHHVDNHIMEKKID